MNHLIYFSYGKGPHVDELRFSAISALHFLAKDQDCTDITIFTDETGAFADIPVRVETLAPEQLLTWDASIGYQHRKKIELIKYALMLLGGKVIFVDSDTYFKRHPKGLFRRVGPRRSLMHRFEAHLDRCEASNLADFLYNHRLKRLNGSFWDINANTFMWNSGLVGLDETSLHLLDEVLNVNDQIFTQIPLPTTEQFAFSGVLTAETILSEGEDIVFHYYEDRWRTPFRKKMSDVFHSPIARTQAEQYAILRSSVPKHGYLRSCRLTLGRLARQAGYTRNKLRVLPPHGNLRESI